MTASKNPTIDRVDKKLAFSFGALTLLLMLLVTMVSSYLFIRLQSREEDRLAGALARIIGESISKVSFSGTYHARLFVEEIKAKTPEIDAVSVESTDGRIIAHSNPAFNGSFVQAEDSRMLRQCLLNKQTVVAERKTPQGATEKVIVLPYGGGIDADTIGVIRLVINVEKTRQDQLSGVISMLVIATLLSLIAVSIILILSRYYGTAVKELAIQLQAILDNSPALIYAKDREGHYQFVNKAWHALFHTTNDRVKGKTDRDLFPADSACQSMQNDQLVMLSDTPLTIEEKLFVEEEVRYYHSTKVAVRDTDGTTYGLCGISTDISERKQAEEEIRKLNEDLEQRVQQRTAELEVSSSELQDNQRTLLNIVDDLNRKTEELEHANAKLLELDQLKSMFIASMSHELRTPLNSIIGFSSIIRDEWLGPVNPEQKENLDTIQRSGKHLLSLINDVIDVSKIEAGRIEVRLEEFDLYDLLMEAIQYVDRDLRDKKLQLSLNIDHYPVCSDRRRLLQCVINLLSNAVKFTDQGEVSVSLQFVAGGPAVISIKDTGIGIAEEDISRLFKPFVRITSPQQAITPGTGLGLYLTRKLVVEVLGGDILCTSDAGKGSCFILRIPERIYEKGAGSRR
jgi:PAS domain S-box-containing protein